ncbi:MAG TPA: phenylalanine--tRNA ligase subunit alpha, partial [Firmicutes bacterium]|nr:phenylalanine--tRNA ligase subunit alpha [Bacillota bacterium]
MQAQLEAIAEEARGIIGAAKDAAELDNARLTFLGKKGKLTAVLRGMGGLPAGDRPRIGAVANTIREEIERLLTAKADDLARLALQKRLESETIDVTMPGLPHRLGTVHPLTKVMN